MSDNLFNLPATHPPRLNELRAQYATAFEAFQASELNEDETGEPIPSQIRRDLTNSESRLRQEEARVAQAATDAITATIKKP